MAQFEIGKELEEMINKLDKMHADDEIYEKMVVEGQNIMLSAIQKEANKHVVTRQMADSLGKTKPRNKDGVWYGNVRFTGNDKIYVNKVKRKEYITNWLKAFRIEYGTSDENAQPFVAPAIESVNDEINKKLQEIYDEEIKKLQ